MLKESLRKWQGKIDYDNTPLTDIENISETGKHVIMLHGYQKSAQQLEEEYTANDTGNVELEIGKTYILYVRDYMIKPATDAFNFMAKFNNDVPMPCREMECRIVKTTRGMVYAKCHAMTEETIRCRVCGKELSNPVSRYYGCGPICLEKLGILVNMEDVQGVKEALKDIFWEGWIIKKAIIEAKEVANE